MPYGDNEGECLHVCDTGRHRSKQHLQLHLSLTSTQVSEKLHVGSYQFLI